MVDILLKNSMQSRLGLTNVQEATYLFIFINYTR
jgi:hypothetical protein